MTNADVCECVHMCSAGIQNKGRQKDIKDCDRNNGKNIACVICYSITCEYEVMNESRCYVTCLWD